MPFGSDIWCSIKVLPKELLEPTKQEVDSLKVVMATSTKSEPETKAEAPESIEITFRPTEEEHLREVYVVREAKDEPEDVVKTSLEATTEVFHSDSTSQLESVENVETSLEQEVDIGKTQTSGNGSPSDTEDGFVVYAKHGDEDLVEVDKKVNKGKVLSFSSFIITNVVLNVI